MNIRILKKCRELASTLLVTLVICSVLSFSVMGYLSLVEQQSNLGRRSQAWNMAIAVVEAGLEEGLQHLNSNFGHLGSDGWGVNGTIYSKTNTLPGGSSYRVILDATTAQPEITCQAYVVAPSVIAHYRTGPIFAYIGDTSGSLISRKVRVRCARGGLFLGAMVAKHRIEMNGNFISTDSFDSADSGSSTRGQYDPTKARDNGDVASNDGIVNAVSVGNANIYGKARTGPGGSVDIGPQGGIGSRSWQQNHNGLQPGWFSADANFSFPDTTMPDTVSYLTPVSGTVTEVTIVNGSPVYSTNYYDNILGTGNYVASDLPGKTLVIGKAVLALPNGWSVPADGSFKIAKAGSVINGSAQDASVTVYCGGTSIKLAGNSIINQPGIAGNFILYACPSVTDFSLDGNGTFVGVLVAPDVDLVMNGSGHDYIDFVGAVLANSVLMNGRYRFHYDEALSRLNDNGRFLISSWDEIPINQ